VRGDGGPRAFGGAVLRRPGRHLVRVLYVARCCMSSLRQLSPSLAATVLQSSPVHLAAYCLPISHLRRDTCSVHQTAPPRPCSSALPALPAHFALHLPPSAGACMPMSCG
jgi:hypothetical protein